MNISRSLFGMALTMTPNRQVRCWWGAGEDNWYVGNSDENWAHYRIGEDNQEYGGEYWDNTESGPFGSWETVDMLLNHPWSLL